MKKVLDGLIVLMAIGGVILGAKGGVILGTIIWAQRGEHAPSRKSGPLANTSAAPQLADSVAPTDQPPSYSSPKADGEDPDEAAILGHLPNPGPLVQCVDHMLDTRSVFVVRYERGADTLLVDKSVHEVASECEWELVSCRGVDPSCHLRGLDYIRLRLLKAWGNQPVSVYDDGGSRMPLR